MKKLLVFVFVVVICVSFAGHAQTPQQLYKSSKLTWFGIDYTNVRLIGEGAFTDKEKIVSTYFNAWNDFVYTEPTVYDVSKYLLKEDVDIQIDYASRKNRMIDPNSLEYLESKSLTASDIDEVLQGYDFEEIEGLGAMLLAEYYNKNRLRASYLLVVFDVQTKSILFNRRYIAKPGGFGFRNYWARTFYNTLKLIRPEMYRWLSGR